jgi:hypothetical protein
MSVGFHTPWEKSCPTVFVVKNIALNKKRVRVFNYPIPYGLTRDLMEIDYVSEADIRHSLLKGELKIKLLEKEIIVVDSNIDLLQFDECQKAFLESVGITKGLEVPSGLNDIPFLFRQGIYLIGVQDNHNRIFSTPDKFIQGPLGGNIFKILIRHNGRDLVEGIDYIVSEGGGAGTGYDTIIFISLTPKPNSVIVADYVVKNTSV